ncbi:MAG: T9SS type A sorting domain-containing protein [Flavobacteriales bacterium]|nr:T9SS type A sorting domain-containing protein [Flavobacteriales bacterium]
MKTLFTLITTLFLSYSISAQIVLNEIQPDAENLVEITNLGDQTVDISTYRLCSWPVYNTLSNLTIVSGSLMLAPGEFLVVTGHSMNQADDELGLYLNNQWTNSNSMLDYVEWGMHGHQRSVVAEAAGIWEDNDFVFTPAMGSSLSWNGGGDTSDFWMIQSSPTFGSANDGGGGPTCDGGSVLIDGGGTSIDLCSGDAEDDIVQFDNDSPSADQYMYVICDANDFILGFPGGSNDFNEAPPGVCRVYGVSFTGNFTAGVGANITQATLSDDCFDISENYIEVTRHNAAAGTINTSDGETATVICIGDGNSDTVIFESDSTLLVDYSFIITDEAGNVLGLPVGDFFDFEEAEPGQCRVYGVAHVGALIIEIGQNIFSDLMYENCGNLSENFIDVFCWYVNGSLIGTDAGETDVTVTIDDDADVLTFETISDAPDDYAYVITDENDLILQLMVDNSHDFNDAEPGVCYVYGVSYIGDLSVPVGEPISNISSGNCFDISDNFVTVTRQLAENISLIDSPQILLFPNPAKDQITLSGGKIDQVQFFDSMGRMVYNTSETTIDIRLLPAGTYLIWVRRGEKLTSEKLVIVR